jgi:hypothetical protein
MSPQSPFPATGKVALLDNHDQVPATASLESRGMGSNSPAMDQVQQRNTFKTVGILRTPQNRSQRWVNLGMGRWGRILVPRLLRAHTLIFVYLVCLGNEAEEVNYLERREV